MTLKEYLDKRPIINRAELARLMWPEKKGASVRLSHKLNETLTKLGSKHRITKDDQERAKEILQQLGHDASEL